MKNPPSLRALDKFQKQMRKRATTGYRIYGDECLGYSVSRMIKEIQDELVDAGNYLAWLYDHLDKLNNYQQPESNREKGG